MGPLVLDEPPLAEEDEPPLTSAGRIRGMVVIERGVEEKERALENSGR